MNKQQKWKTVKIHELCFRYLEEGHKVAKCGWGLVCNINKYLKKHNIMLHIANQEDKIEQNSVQQ